MVIIAILLYNYAKYLKNRTLFVPRSDIVWNAIDDPEYDVDDVNLLVEGQRLHGWFFRPTLPHDDDRVLLFLHGNFANVSYRQTLIDLILNVWRYPVLFFDYRGYGQSEGQPSLSNIKKDSEAMYRYLRDRGYEDDQISIWGKSLGGYGASYLASRYPVDSLILMYTFSKFSSVMDNNRMISKLTGFFMDGDTDNVDHIRDCKAKKVCFLHSEDDGFIPSRCSKDLHDNVGSSCRSLYLPIGGTHSRPRIGVECFKNLCRHIDVKIPSDVDDSKLREWLDKIENIEVLQQALEEIL